MRGSIPLATVRGFTLTPMTDTTGKKRGQRSEKRCLEGVFLFVTTWPEWLHDVRRATFEEDHGKGWDIVAETDRGLLGVQVKSNPKNASSFRRRHPEVPVFSVLTSSGREKDTYSCGRTVLDLFIDQYDVLCDPSSPSTQNSNEPELARTAGAAG